MAVAWICNREYVNGIKHFFYLTKRHLKNENFLNIINLFVDAPKMFSHEICVTTRSVTHFCFSVTSVIPRLEFVVHSQTRVQNRRGTNRRWILFGLFGYGESEGVWFHLVGEERQRHPRSGRRDSGRKGIPAARYLDHELSHIQMHRE